MADVYRPPDVVEQARDREDKYRSDTEDQWAAKLDALDAARPARTLDGSCLYCGRDSCGCAHGWFVNALLNGDEVWG